MIAHGQRQVEKYQHIKKEIDDDKAFDFQTRLTVFTLGGLIRSWFDRSVARPCSPLWKFATEPCTSYSCT
jgi:hypothetical protein